MKAKKTTVAKATGNESKLTKGKSAPFPTDIKPMLATLVDQPVEEEGWMYEVKWDGYRAIGYVHEETVEIRSRNNKSFNDKFYPVYNALQKWGEDLVVDGEIVVLNNKGVPDFGALQTWRSEADGQLAYYLFDILWFNGKDLMNVPLQERREILRSVVPNEGIIKLSENFEATGSEFFALADKMGLEGIMAKKANSIYVPDARSKDWLKIKTEKHQELIIGGYTRNEGTPKPFSALLLGWFVNDEFHHVTPVGTGFNVKTQKEILEKLKPLETPECPFIHVPAYNKPSRFRPNPPKAEVTWVRPEMVCEISYREMTKDGSIRHPSFRGLREDKNAKDVVRETPVAITEIVNEENKLVKKKVLATPVQQERKTLLNPNEETQVKNVGGHDMKFTNLSKVYWPDEKVTKRDMINYYYQVAPYMLPYVKDRPQTLNRFPHGIKGE
ncbi:MAG: ligase, partial [Segetibacter sp.]|nr:ligase [Segetibacter sp.]